MTRIGFDAGWSHGVVVHGYALDGLTGAQCATLESAIAALGAGFVAVPNGDLSPATLDACGGPDEACSFTFVVGRLVAEVRVKATQAAGQKKVSFDDKACAEAARGVADGRPKIDTLLSRIEVEPNGEPGLFALAAGPLACAKLEGKGDTAIRQILDEDDVEDYSSLEITYDANPDAVRVRLKGELTLSVSYS
jgi:hypothetical protein